MRRIGIIGSGQAGLLTAHALLQAGYEVTLYSDRTAEQWLHQSRPTGTAARFRDALAFERELGLNYWETEAPAFHGIYLTFCQEIRNPLLALKGRASAGGQAIDLRLQSHRWLNEFEKRGGRLFVEKVTVARLDEIAAENDLTIVATGRGPLAQLFGRDPLRSVYEQPQRHLAMVIVTGAPMKVSDVPFTPVKFNFAAPIGESFWVPYFHKTLGATWNLVFEARPGGQMDRFGEAKSGHEAVTIAKEVIRDLFPWDWEWARHMELADENGWLVGRFPPTVRLPVGTLPSGRIVTPVGDASMALDPIGGQGANNGSRMARHLVQAIIERGDRPFTAEWMTSTFEQFYSQYGQVTYSFNNMLLEPITPAGKELLIAQVGSDGRVANTSGQQAIANAFCDNFIDPRTLTPAFQDTKKARAFIQQRTGRHWLWSAVNGRFTIAKDQIRHKLGLRQLEIIPNLAPWPQPNPFHSGD